MIEMFLIFRKYLKPSNINCEHLYHDVNNSCLQFVVSRFYSGIIFQNFIRNWIELWSILRHSEHMMISIFLSQKYSNCCKTLFFGGKYTVCRQQKHGIPQKRILTPSPTNANLKLIASAIVQHQCNIQHILQLGLLVRSAGFYHQLKASACPAAG